MTKELEALFRVNQPKAKKEVTASVPYPSEVGLMVEVKAGDWISFKADVEQEAVIVKIEKGYSGILITVKAPDNGFAGSYIGHQKFHTIDADECWAE